MAARFGTTVQPGRSPEHKFRAQIAKIQNLFDTANYGHAERHARELLVLHPDNIQLNFLMAQIMVGLDKHKDAIPFAETAVKLAPFHPGTNYFLGRLYIYIQLFEKAAPLLFESVKKAPNSALLYWALGDMYSDMNQGDLAVKNYAMAKQLPLDESRKLEIIKLYAGALSTVDRHSEAAEQLAEIKDFPGMKAHFLYQQSRDPKFDHLEQLQQNLSAELEQQQINDEALGFLHHGLGNVLDRQKDHDGSYKQWEISRSFITKPFSIDLFGETVNNIVTIFSNDVLKNLSQFGNRSELPVFVFGMARSGTTLTEQIISAHRDGAGVGELGRMNQLEEKFFSAHAENDDDQKVFRDAQNGELQHNAQEYLNLLGKLVTGKPIRIVDKAVSQYMSAGFIHACFPNARFIHCERHPADSFVSAFQNRLHHLYVSNQEHYAKYFLGKEKLMAHWRTCFPDRIYDLKYERLVQDPETVVRELIAFLGLEWDPNCMKFFEQKSTVRTLSLHQVRQPIYTSSVYKWKKYEKHLSLLFQTLKDAGYEYPEVQV